MPVSRIVFAVAATVAVSASGARAQHVPHLQGAEAIGQVDIVLPWYNGLLADIGIDVACLSDPPINEIRVQGYAGFSLLPPNYTPAVGEVFYTHLVLSHPGDPCAGSAIGVELLLPAGVSTATSASNPAFCFASTPANQQHPFPLLIDLGSDPGYGCPQGYAQGLEGLRVSPPAGGAGGGWGMAAGFLLELLIPLRADATQPGNTSIGFRVNPDIGVVGYPSVPLLVNDDVIFRTPMEDNRLTLDICLFTPVASGC
jgi:hypothetical protein